MFKEPMKWFLFNKWNVLLAGSFNCFSLEFRLEEYCKAYNTHFPFNRAAERVAFKGCDVRMFASISHIF